MAGGQFVFLKTQGRCIDNMAVMEPAAMKIALGENPKKTYRDNHMMPSTRMFTAAMFREELYEALAQYIQIKSIEIKRWHGQPIPFSMV